MALRAPSPINCLANIMPVDKVGWNQVDKVINGWPGPVHARSARKQFKHSLYNLVRAVHRACIDYAI